MIHQSVHRKYPRTGTSVHCRGLLLLLELVLLEHLLVLGGLILLEVREELAALRDFSEESAACGVIFLVIFEVIGEKTDLLGEQSNLDLRRTGVLGVLAVLGDESFFRGALENHKRRCARKNN